MEKKKAGINLIEVLVVVLVVVTLGVTLYIAANPLLRFADARDARRREDVKKILVPAKGRTFEPGIEYQVGTAKSGCGEVLPGCKTMSNECLDLSDIVAIPHDPQKGVGSAEKTGYKVFKDTQGVVTVSACASESAGVQIFVSQ